MIWKIADGDKDNTCCECTVITMATATIRNMLFTNTNKNTKSHPALLQNLPSSFCSSFIPFSRAFIYSSFPSFPLFCSLLILYHLFILSFFLLSLASFSPHFFLSGQNSSRFRIIQLSHTHLHAAPHPPTFHTTVALFSLSHTLTLVHWNKHLYKPNSCVSHQK